jgi:DNA polymerase-3 subunit gamma/tau
MAAFSAGDITAADVEVSLGRIDSDALADIKRLIANRDTPSCFAWVAGQVDKGADLAEVTRLLLEYTRDMYVTSTLGAESGLINRSDDELATLCTLADSFVGSERIVRFLDLLFELADKLRWSTEPRILVELTLARATSPQGEMTLEALAERIECLEKNDKHPKTAVASVTETPAANTPTTDTPTAPAALEGDPASLKRQWRAVLTELHKRSIPLHPIFADTQLSLGADDTSLLIEFPAGADYKLKQARRTDVLELLTDTVAAVYGKEVPFVMKLAAADNPQLPHLETSAPTINDIVEDESTDEEFEQERETTTEVNANGFLQETPTPSPPSSAATPEIASLLDDLGATIVSQTSN